jgi:hypothetical protein
MYTSTLSLTWVLYEVGGQRHVQAALTQGKSGFSGLVVSMLDSGTQVRGFKSG